MELHNIVLIAADQTEPRDEFGLWPSRTGIQLNSGEIETVFRMRLRSDMLKHRNEHAKKISRGKGTMTEHKIRWSTAQ
jgi:hypothetical protein